MNHDAGNPSSHRGNTQSPRTVNEMIAQARRERTGPPSIRAIRRLQETFNQPTLPPEQRDILHIPSTIEISLRNPEGHRPPPQEAWNYVFQENNPLTRPLKSGTASRFRQRPSKLSDLVKLLQYRTEPPMLPKEKTLVFTCLKTAAKGCSGAHTLPGSNSPKVSSLLMALLSMFGPEHGITVSVLRDIIVEPRSTYTLDFNGLLSDKLDLTDIQRFITKAPKKALTQHLSPEESTWEQLASETYEITIHPRAIPFEKLTHLGLGNPGKKASWPLLLDLAVHLRGLTHLSLAYWPSPSLRSTSNTGFEDRIILPDYEEVRSKPFFEVRAIVQRAINEHFIRRTNEFETAARILKTLSEHLYQLKYLDLEGCHGWFPAIAWREHINTRRTTNVNVGLRQTSWATETEQPDFIKGFIPAIAGAWVQLKEVNISQGWVPSNVQSVARMSGNEMFRYIKASFEKKFPDLVWPLERELPPAHTVCTREDFETLTWFELEEAIRRSIHQAHMVRIETEANYERIVFRDSIEADFLEIYQHAS